MAHPPICLAIPAAAAAIGGCAAEPLLLHARMSEEEIRATVDGSFPPGTTVENVHAGLDALNVSRRSRRLYPGPPPTMLVRLFERRGHWPRRDGYDDVTYADVWFLFDGSGRLERTEAERRTQRYLDGDPIDPPFTTLDLPPREPPGWLRSGADPGPG